MGVFLQRLGLLSTNFIVSSGNPISVIGGSSKQQGAGAVEDDVDWPVGTLVGDLAIIAFRIDGLDTINIPSGWEGSAYIVDTATNDAGNHTRIFHKLLDVDDITAGLVTITHDAGRTAHICYTVRDASGNIEIAAFEHTTGSADADPPYLTPSWGVKEGVWIVGCAWPFGDMSVTTWPTGYDGLQTEQGTNLNNSGGADLAMSYKILNAHSEDPSAFTLDTRADQFNSAWIIAVEPSFVPEIAEYIYYKVDITATQGSGYISCDELELLDADDNNVALSSARGGIATASSTDETRSGNPVGLYQAEDDEPTVARAGWVTDGASTGWTQWYDNLAIDCVSAVITCAVPGEMIKDFTIKYSDNGTTWFTATTVVGEAVWEISEVRIYDWASVGAHRYWRLDCTLNQGDADLSIRVLRYIDADGEIITSLKRVATIRTLSHFDDGSLPRRMFNQEDGSPGTFTLWLSGAGETNTIYIHTGVPTRVKSFKWWVSYQGGWQNANMPKNFTIHGSNNNVDWDLLKYVTGDTDWVNLPHTYELNAAFDPPPDPPGNDHRYWRVVEVTGGENGYTSVAEIQFRDEVGGIDMTGSGTPIASSERGSSYASKAFDDVTTNYWSPDRYSSGPWIGYDFGSGNEITINEVLLTARHTQYFTQMIQDFDFEYSDDGIEWTPAKSFTSVGAYTIGETKTFDTTI